MKLDFEIEYHGSVCILYAMSLAADDWVESHIPEDASKWCGGIVVQANCILAIIQGIMEDGLKILHTGGL